MIDHGLVRRSYNHKVSKAESSDRVDNEVMKDQFEKIYGILPIYSGEVLLDELNKHLDMSNTLGF